MPLLHNWSFVGEKNGELREKKWTFGRRAVKRREGVSETHRDSTTQYIPHFSHPSVPFLFPLQPWLFPQQQGQLCNFSLTKIISHQISSLFLWFHWKKIPLSNPVEWNHLSSKLSFRSKNKIVKFIITCHTKRYTLSASLSSDPS